MVEIDLSTLGPAELRRLSKAARARGDGLLADRVDWEIATRADHGYGHGLPTLEPLPMDPEPEPEPELDFEAALAADAEPAPAFTPPDYDAPEPGGRWLHAGLLALGVLVGSAATAGGFWAADAFGRREPETRVMAVRTVPPPAPAVFTSQPRPIQVAAAEPERPKARRAVRRSARPAPAQDPDRDRIARAYERGTREIDAARARELEPIY